MSHTVYEFPLNEKVRTYLRLEQLFQQVDFASAHAESHWQYMSFFEALFTLLDLLERLDIRNDLYKDIESHEKNLVHWSQHPNIDTDALQTALQKIVRIRDELKHAKRIGSELKEDKFLSSIRQRFAIPGGTCSFDLPNLHYWLNQPKAQIDNNIAGWKNELGLVKEAISITLSFLRERGQFMPIQAVNGFHQGVSDDKTELVRVHSATDKGYYPTLSGNKYRYAIRFMRFSISESNNSAVEETIEFQLASC